MNWVTEFLEAEADEPTAELSEDGTGRLHKPELPPGRYDAKIHNAAEYWSVGSWEFKRPARQFFWFRFWTREGVVGKRVNVPWGGCNPGVQRHFVKDMGMLGITGEMLDDGLDRALGSVLGDVFRIRVYESPDARGKTWVNVDLLERLDRCAALGPVGGAPC